MLGRWGGAAVTLSSSWDSAHPPEHALDGQKDTYWVTTGAFPQEIVITLSAPMRITSLETRTAGVRHMTIQKSTTETPSGWDDIRVTEIPDGGDEVQTETHAVDPTTVRHLRILLRSGHGEFAAVYSVNAQGTPV